jgi:hypothetical protein
MRRGGGVEALEAHLQTMTFARHCETLRKDDIEVSAAGRDNQIAPRIADYPGALPVTNLVSNQ